MALPRLQQTPGSLGRCENAKPLLGDTPSSNATRKSKILCDSLAELKWHFAEYIFSIVNTFDKVLNVSDLLMRQGFYQAFES